MSLVFTTHASSEGSDEPAQMYSLVRAFGTHTHKLSCVLQYSFRERSGSVVECLTQDCGVVGSSLTGITALCP